MTLFALSASPPATPKSPTNSHKKSFGHKQKVQYILPSISHWSFEQVGTVSGDCSIVEHVTHWGHSSSTSYQTTVESM
jgi:hypothetical protein